MAGFSTQLENIASTYATDKIFILGKGPSVDEIRPEIFAGSLVIGINDAERIIPTDISIFHDEWVLDGLRESGFKSQLYVSPFDFDSKGKQVVVAKYVPMTQESSDLIMQRFMGDEFFIEDVILLSALKLAKEIANIKRRNQKVYMVGFDFDPALGRSAKIGRDYAPGYSDENAIRISVQEYFFINALYFLKSSNVEVKHVGTRPFSDLTTREFNEELLPSLGHGGSASQVSIVAELTTNHFGDRARLARMARLAKASGADYIKLQKRDVSTFYSKEQLASPYVSPFGNTFADYRYQLELSKDDFEFVNNLCRELDIGWFASVLDQASFKFMMELGPEMIKLPSTISEHKDYLRYVSKNWKGGVILSTGMTDKNYENFVLDNFLECDKLFLLQCNSAYPTPLHDCNIAVVRHYYELSKKYPKIVPGYSSHDFGWEASALAIAAGAKMVEKHVKLGNTEWAHFDAVAVDLTTDDFQEYVGRLREAEVIMGSEEKQVNDSEHHKYFK